MQHTQLDDTSAHHGDWRRWRTGHWLLLLHSLLSGSTDRQSVGRRDETEGKGRGAVIVLTISHTDQIHTHTERERERERAGVRDVAQWLTSAVAGQWCQTITVWQIYIWILIWTTVIVMSANKPSTMCSVSDCVLCCYVFSWCSIRSFRCVHGSMNDSLTLRAFPALKKADELHFHFTITQQYCTYTVCWCTFEDSILLTYFRIVIFICKQSISFLSVNSNTLYTAYCWKAI